MSESDLDGRLLQLGQRVRQGGDPFRCVVARAKARPEYEEVVFKFPELRGRGQASERVNLKILHAMDELRAPDVSRQGFRISSMGEMRRIRWPEISPHPHHYGLEGRSDGLHRNRALHSIPEASFQIPVMNLARGHEIEEARWQLAPDEPAFDFSTTLLLHMSFIGDDLVIALDENLGRFCYGVRGLNSGTVHASSFSDYGYLPETLDPTGVFWGPVCQPGVRLRVQRLAERLHGAFENNLDCQLQTPFLEEFAKTLDLLLGFSSIEEQLMMWAKKRGCTLADICLVFLPDDALFLLPLGLLGLSCERPLARVLGGTCVAFSLVGLKKSIADHHWGMAPNKRPDGPTCVVFATNNEHSPWLDLRPEVDAVERAFKGRSRSVCTCTRHEFNHWYSVADVCWFAGHGSYAVNRGIEVDGEMLPLPESGPLFTDGPVTNVDLISAPQWNFKPLWLSVFNSCVLGRHLMVGPNPLGFMSALATVGATAVIGALWPVGNDAANTLAEHLAPEIVSAFDDRRFPRARALSGAIRRALESGKVTEWDVAPYVLWGVP